MRGSAATSTPPSDISLRRVPYFPILAVGKHQAQCDPCRHDVQALAIHLPKCNLKSVNCSPRELQITNHNLQMIAGITQFPELNESLIMNTPCFKYHRPLNIDDLSLASRATRRCWQITAHHTESNHRHMTNPITPIQLFPSMISSITGIGTASAGPITMAMNYCATH